MSRDPIIVTEHITKEFLRMEEHGEGLLTAIRNKLHPRRKTITAVEDVSLEVNEGELFGLLGPNGAGKTTLVKLLCTLLLPTRGRASVCGHDVVNEAERVRRVVGVVLGGERALYWRLTARENLWFFSQLYDMPGDLAARRIDELLEMVGLSDRADDRVENYSKGMKQRLHIARGLLNDPEVILMDEPTIGLDPAAARDIRSLIRNLTSKQGKTIVLTTHYMYEADELSDRVGILNRGRIIALDTPANLKDMTRGGAIIITVRDPPDDLQDELASLDRVEKAVRTAVDANRNSIQYRVITQDPDGVGPKILEAVVRLNCELISLVRDVPTLEDVFISMTGESLSITDERAMPPYPSKGGHRHGRGR